MKSLITILSVGLLFVSCEKQDGSRVEDPATTPLLVVFCAPGMAPSGATAGTRTATGVRLDDETTVRILAYKRAGTDPNLAADEYVGENAYYYNQSTSELVACAVDPVTGALAAGAGTSLLLVQGIYDFYAITPALPVDHSGSAPTVSVGHGVDYAVSLTPVVAVSPPTQAVPLEMLVRQCSKLVFEVGSLNPNVTSLEIKKISLSSLADDPIDVDLGEDIDLSGLTYSDYDVNPLVLPALFDTNSGPPVKASGKAIVLPRDATIAAADAVLKMEVEIEGNPVELGPIGISDLKLLRGCRYTFNISIKGGRLVLTITVSDWGDVVWSVEVGSALIRCDDWVGIGLEADEGNNLIETGGWDAIPGANDNVGTVSDGSNESDWDDKPADNTDVGTVSDGSNHSGWGDSPWGTDMGGTDDDTE